MDPNPTPTPHPHLGQVVDWLAASGIASVVLRYRLLPRFSIEDSLDDLEAAVRRVRQMRSGPVAAIGFSAGGHLIASLGLRANGTLLDLNPRPRPNPQSSTFTAHRSPLTTHRSPFTLTLTLTLTLPRSTCSTMSSSSARTFCTRSCSNPTLNPTPAPNPNLLYAELI